MNSIGINSGHLLLLALTGVNAGISYKLSEINKELSNSKVASLFNPKAAATFSAAATLATVGVGYYLYKGLVEAGGRVLGNTVSGVGLMGQVAAGGVSLVAGVASGFFAGKFAAWATGNPMSDQNIAMVGGVWGVGLNLVQNLSQPKQQVKPKQQPKPN